ncbi:hypothetical protein CR105_23985 [Massilia eurypsychrophila]|jgi:hypothetical protein|uniref:Uncharacterized protein n=1 Tax=Massilia eurypsychrophila TaxID=1485217 RepID=A0A2G8T916_9BURK|nr:hypothetical protein CR105_23985 [Massilia eurypsychrophila]
MAPALGRPPVERMIMLIQTYAVNGEFGTTFIAQTEIDALGLMVAAESREQEARRRGRVWTAGAVPFFAQELITAMRARKPRKELELEAVNAAMSAWLCDSIYDGVTAEQFIASDLIFTVLPGGAVKYDRVPAGSIKPET